MKSLRLLLCLLLLPALHPAARAMPSDQREMAADQLQTFYQWYTHLLITKADPLTKQRKEWKKSVSARYLKEIDKAMKKEGGLDADPFISAQDYGSDWAKNITVTDVSVLGEHERITATVKFGGKEMKHSIKVTMVPEDGAFKIDKVEEAAAH